MGTAGIGGSAIVGSGAFTRVESQRQVKIETVGDDDAYLKLVYNDEIEFDCKDKKTLLWVTNQLKSKITEIKFTVEDPDDGKIIIEKVEVPSSLGVGNEGKIIGELICEEGGTRTVNFDIEVDGEDFEVIAHRTDEIELECFCPKEEDTAWAILKDDVGDADETDNRLNQLDGIGRNRWGWFMPYEISSEEVTAEFHAGAGLNRINGTYVSDVTIDGDESNLIVDIDLEYTDELSETHLYVDTDTDGILPANPGGFPYSDESDEFESDDTKYTIPLEDIGDNGVGENDEIILALHGVVDEALRRDRPD